jgi:hypothetical protein
LNVFDLMISQLLAELGGQVAHSIAFSVDLWAGSS